MKTKFYNGNKNETNSSGFQAQAKTKMQCIVLGALAGFVNGLFGGGGGMIVVPLLMHLLKLKSKNAHATAILIILPMSIVSGLLYASGKTLDLALTIPTSIGVTLGGVLGAFALNKLSNNWVSIIFSIVMAIAVVKLLFF